MVQVLRTNRKDSSQQVSKKGCGDNLRETKVSKDAYVMISAGRADHVTWHPAKAWPLGG